jgi:hypothetical protein
MKTILSLVVVAAFATTAAACPVAVQSFATCGVAAQAVVPSCAAVQVAPAAFALQSFAVVPQVHVQAFAVQAVPVQQVAIFGGCRHGCAVNVLGGRVRAFGGGRSVIRQRSVIRTR